MVVILEKPLLETLKNGKAATFIVFQTPEEGIGIPVDPGNLLVLGRIGSKYIIAAPGSARSARENSFDGVLDRLMAGMELDAADLARMGVGGLLL